jgi:diadenosine tetraphosphate (Ap4A) HIT family hydrolase
VPNIEELHALVRKFPASVAWLDDSESWRARFTLAHAVQKAFQAEGLTVLQFNGAAGGQTVFHLHFHLIPRQEGVGLIGHGQAGKASEEDLISHQAAILAAF